MWWIFDVELEIYYSVLSLLCKRRHFYFNGLSLRDGHDKLESGSYCWDVNPWLAGLLLPLEGGAKQQVLYFFPTFPKLQQ